MALTRLHGYGHIAQKYGVEESIFLDSIVYWYTHNRANNINYKDGRWWTYNSIAAYTEIFPWWSTRQIRRIIKSCVDQGALLTANYNSDGRDRTFWYTPSDTLLQLYDICICQNGQMQVPDAANACDQTDKPLPCSYIHDATNPPVSPPAGDEPPKKKKRKRAQAKTQPDWEPERFKGFWAMYPRKAAKQLAIAAWDALQLSTKDINHMAKALQRQVKSEEWQEPKYIPHPATYLRQRRWEDELPADQQQAPANVGGGLQEW